MPSRQQSLLRKADLVVIIIVVVFIRPSIVVLLLFLLGLHNDLCLKEHCIIVRIYALLLDKRIANAAPVCVGWQGAERDTPTAVYTRIA